MSSINTLLKYYNENKIIPVHQTGDKASHFQARNILYNHLGLPPIAIKGSNILEVAPGYGKNAMHTSSFHPSLLTLVEPSIAGNNEINKLIIENRFNCPVKLVSETIEDFHSNNKNKYDIVICEGLLESSGYQDPNSILSLVKSFVVEGGSLIITCSDEVGNLSEMARRLIAKKLLMDFEISDKFDDRIAFLIPYFKNHLKSFNGISKRSIFDWVADVLLNPALDYPFFSISDAVLFLKDDFKIINTSPRMSSELVYYKVAAKMSNNFENESLINAYKQNLTNFLDYRVPYDIDHEIRMDKFNNTCVKICRSIKNTDTLLTDKTVNQVIDGFAQLNNFLTDKFEITKHSIDELINVLNSTMLSVQEFNQFNRLSGWFGRCQTYLHFIKN